MTAATNVGSTKRMVAALKACERLTETNIALGTLAITTARALDEVLGSDEKRYVVDRLARAHLMVLKALEEAPEPKVDDGFAELMKQVSTPSRGDTPWDRL